MNVEGINKPSPQRSRPGVSASPGAPSSDQISNASLEHLVYTWGILAHLRRLWEHWSSRQ